MLRSLARLPPTHTLRHRTCTPLHDDTTCVLRQRQQRCTLATNVGSSASIGRTRLVATPHGSRSFATTAATHGKASKAKMKVARARAAAIEAARLAAQEGVVAGGQRHKGQTTQGQQQYRPMPGNPAKNRLGPAVKREHPSYAAYGEPAELPEALRSLQQQLQGTASGGLSGTGTGSVAGQTQDSSPFGRSFDSEPQPGEGQGPSPRERAVERGPAPHLFGTPGCWLVPPAQRGFEESRVIKAKDPYLRESAWREQSVAGTLGTAAVGGKLQPHSVPFHPVKPLREMHVAKLAHGLDKVLFQKGVHTMKNTYTGEYNFPPLLVDVPDVDLFDYRAFPPYVTSSLDEELKTIAAREGASFFGSTSSLTGMLSQVYFLISNWKGPELGGFSPEFASEALGFGYSTRMAACVALRPRSVATNDGTTPARKMYAVDQDKGRVGELENSNYILTNLGKVLEKKLTESRADFERNLRVNRPRDAPEGDSLPREAYHYVKAGDAFVMRSQLDCSHEALPGKNFDLKTRAVVSVRSDRANWSEASGYQITDEHGLWGSFEREKYDMTRSAMLKYYFQARIGCMDGIFVAYHNTAQFFGFEYLSCGEMARALFGSEEQADQAFRLAIGLSERILQRAVELFPGRQLHLTLDSEPAPNCTAMQVYIEPDPPEPGTPAPDLDEKLKDRQVIQMDVAVDRYMWDSLIGGAVNFAAYQGQEQPQQPHGQDGQDGSQPNAGKTKTKTKSTPKSKSEKKRAPLWKLEYKLSPRLDLSPAQTSEHLAKVRARLAALSSLAQPNVTELNDRERRLEAALAVNPDALQRYKEDKASGLAKGMPRAPGQIELFALGEGEGEGEGEGKVSEEVARALQEEGIEVREVRLGQGTDEEPDRIVVASAGADESRSESLASASASASASTDVPRPRPGRRSDAPRGRGPGRGRGRELDPDASLDAAVDPRSIDDAEAAAWARLPHSPPSPSGSPAAPPASPVSASASASAAASASPIPIPTRYMTLPHPSGRGTRRVSIEVVGEGRWEAPSRRVALLRKLSQAGRGAGGAETRQAAEMARRELARIRDGDGEESRGGSASALE